MNLNELSKLKYKEIKKETIINYPKIKDFCSYPYPNHKKGCPNILKCKSLNIPNFKKILKTNNYTFFYLVYLEFNFIKYKEIRKFENPSFFNTKERLKCVLYWQGSLKKIIKNYLELLRLNNHLFYVLGCGSGIKLSFQDKVGSMENACINVFSTLKLNNITFEVKPINKVILCNLLLSKRKLIFNF